MTTNAFKSQLYYVLYNETLETTDGCDGQVTFEFKHETARAGNTLQIRTIPSLNVNYEYGAGREGKQFTLEKEWTKTIRYSK